MTRPLATLLALLLPALQSTGTASAQDLEVYQPLEIRHVCTARPIMSTPGGDAARMLEAGEPLRLQDVTFDRDGGAWFALDYPTGRGLERTTGYLPVSDAKHFCHGPGSSAPEASGGQLQTYLAPPNLCHLVAGSTPTIEALNVLAAELPAFAPVLSGWRLQSGGYALTLGLISTENSAWVIAQSPGLPAGSSCVSGDGFAEALRRTDSGFSEPERQDAGRLASAQAMLSKAVGSGNPEGMKRACELGLGAACTDFARTIHDDPDGPGRGPAVVTRYALLGCMAGDSEGCQMAVNRKDNTLEFARDQSTAGGEDSATTELSKGLCDANDRFGCVLQARGTARDRDPSLVEAASNFAANLTACEQGISWVCGELGEAFGLIVKARGKDSPAPNERFALASMVAGLCTEGPREPAQRSCIGAYYGYRDFLNYTPAAELDAARVGEAVAVLTSGCAAGDPPACGTLAAMPKHWSEADRRAATARVIALCDAQDSKDSICESLGGILDPTFPESRPVLRERYDRLAQRCLGRTEGDSQDCLWALHSYAALKEPDGLATAEAMLNAACSPENIRGCSTLAVLYGERGHESQGITIPGRNDSAARLAVLQMGCRGGSGRDGNTCAELSDAMAAEGKGENAIVLRGKACESLIGKGEREDLWQCYEAAKLALAENLRLREAFRWADYACQGSDFSVSPYACKLVGNINARGLGRPADPQAALLAYQQGCFHHSVSTTDGESCLNYGGMLLDAVRQGSGAGLLQIIGERSEDATDALVVTEASRAFDMGCMDAIDQACTANSRLLDEWGKGDLPLDNQICEVRTAEGKITSQKPCRGFVFYQAAEAMKASRHQIALEVYVWPDGDRSVTYEDDGIWRLNEIRTEAPSWDNGTRCWHNPVSTRSFCVTPAD